MAFNVFLEKADAEIDAEEQAEADAARAAAAEQAAAERAARESGSAELLIASVNPTLCPMAGSVLFFFESILFDIMFFFCLILYSDFGICFCSAQVSIVLENAPVSGLTVKIAGRKVYHTAKRKGALDVVLECQAPRVDREGFQPIQVTAPDGREAMVDSVLLYADVKVPVSQSSSKPAAPTEPVSDSLLDVAQLDEMDNFLDNLDI